MAGPGRTSKFTEDAREKILAAISEGIPRKYAAQKAGIEESTLRRWLIRARKEKQGPYYTFCTDIKRAEAEAIEKHSKAITLAIDKSWQAAAWWLERRYPEEYGQQRTEIAELKKAVANLEKASARSIGPGASEGQPAAINPMPSG